MSKFAVFFWLYHTLFGAIKSHHDLPTMMQNLIDKLRLPFRKERQFAISLYQIMGFYPHRLEIYHTALTHKSQGFRNGKGYAVNNERLEFLGDAILEAVVSDIVYHRYERKHEGFLTNTRSKIVQRATLNRLATELRIDQLVQCATSGGSHNCYMGGNAFEALMGAIYLDRGYQHCKWFIEQRILGHLLNIDNIAKKEVNFKSKLLEWSQKNRMNIVYKVDDVENAEGNSPTFTCQVMIEELLAGEGTGFSKKESHQNAAKQALTKLRKDEGFVQKIFQAKEQRTAMEAPEMCAVPDIETEDTEQPDTNSTPDAPQDAKTSPKRRRAHGTSSRAPKTTEQKQDAAENAEIIASAPRNKAKNAVTSPLNERELIIAQAEEAAFNEPNSL